MKRIFMIATLMLTAILTAQTATWTGTKTLGSTLKFANVLQNNANTRILSLDASGKPGWRTVGSLTVKATLQGTTNVALGNDILNNNTNGGYNVGIGFNSLNSNTSGNANIAIGDQCLPENTTGSYNIAIGYRPAPRITTGEHNIILTTQNTSNSSLTTGSGNTIIGGNMRGILPLSDPANNNSNASNCVIIGANGINRMLVDSNGKTILLGSLSAVIPIYNDDSEADADPLLISGDLYKLTNIRDVKQKP